jgi:hypothetical protein
MLFGGEDNIVYGVLAGVFFLLLTFVCINYAVEAKNTQEPDVSEIRYWLKLSIIPLLIALLSLLLGLWFVIPLLCLIFTLLLAVGARELIKTIKFAYFGDQAQQNQTQQEDY